MKALVTALLLAVIGTASAQAPAGPPPGSTGMCKDGTYSEAASKRGACAGHKGVKDWYATAAAKADATPSTPPAAAPGAPVPPATTASASRPAPPTKTGSTTAPAAGGGNGQVWVNSRSKVYHCEGDRYYGKTKEGSYMTESAASSAGNRPDHGKACKAA